MLRRKLANAGRVWSGIERLAARRPPAPAKVLPSGDGAIEGRRLADLDELDLSAVDRPQVATQVGAVTPAQPREVGIEAGRQHNAGIGARSAGPDPQAGPPRALG